MDLKNAVAVCLITLFSATLVLLIARSLDSQAASRLEPQLAKIVEELEAIRKSGGLPSVGHGNAPPNGRAGAGVAAESQSDDDAVMVYYFHGNMRCPTCKGIQSQAHETVESEFASQVESGEVAWKVLNYEEPAGTELGEKFEIQMPVVVVARISGGQIEDWKRLDEVWALVGDKPAFAEYLRNEVNRMLEATAGRPTLASPEGLSEIPLPAVDTSGHPLPGMAPESGALPANRQASPSARGADASGNVLRIPGPRDTSTADRSADIPWTR